MAVVMALAVGCGAFAATEAGAPVPPKDCGILKTGGKRYNIKADQLLCRTARYYADRYLDRNRRPRGYRCREYGRETSIEFRCQRGDRVFFAIRR